jgi:hypothetical protein
MSALGQKRIFPLSALGRALGDDVDDLKCHHYFAGLIDYLDWDMFATAAAESFRGIQSVMGVYRVSAR